MDGLRRILPPAFVALCAGLTAVVVLGGLSADPMLKLIETLAVARLRRGRSCSAARWRSACAWPTGRSRRPRRSSTASSSAPSAWPATASPTSPTRPTSSTSTRSTTTTSRSSSRDALDELPDLLRNLVENHNVAVVVSDDGRRHRAYGLYIGDGATRDEVPDRIVIFRDTLRRDFGHAPDLLREQVVKTVRHELAHHVGFDELGVRDLGL